MPNERGPVGGAGELTARLIKESRHLAEWLVSEWFYINAAGIYARGEAFSAAHEVIKLCAAKAPQGVPKFAHDHSNLEEFIHDLAEATVYNTDDTGRVIAEYWKIEAIEWAKGLGPREAAAPKPAPLVTAAKDMSAQALESGALAARPTPAPGAERLRERLQALPKLAQMWDRKGGTIILIDREAVDAVMREALAAAPPALREMDIRDFAAELYQVCGSLGAPAPVLDQLSAAAQGKPLPYTTLLPFPDVAGDRHASAERVRELEQAIQAINEEYEAYLDAPGSAPTDALIVAIGRANKLLPAGTP